MEVEWKGFYTLGVTPRRVQGAKGDYVESIKETYSVPEGVFTPANERVHARLAMVGLFGLLFLEMCTGSALL